MKRLKLTLFFCLLIHADLSFSQSCNPNMIADAPDSRYTLNANGTAVDKKTGLTWMRCMLGQTWRHSTCEGYAQGYSWQSALQAAKSTVFAGLNDWRLPNVKELQSLIENRCSDPRINRTVFPATDGFLWSSSFDVTLGLSAWFVDFSAAEISGTFPKEESHAIQLVRGG